jgi:hypothetical protein
MSTKIWESIDMLEIIETIGSTNLAALQVLGMAISGIAGLIMSWISRRSTNYRKIDKSVLLSAFLFFIYLNAVQILFLSIITVAFVFVPERFALQMFISIGVAALTILLLWGVIFRSKRIKAMMSQAKKISRRLYLKINWLSIISLILAFVFMPFDFEAYITSQRHLLAYIIVYVSGIGSIYWFFLIVTLIWKSSKYVYSEMKITLLDGEQIQHNCSPQMCRIHRNYVRLLKRDDKGKIVYERHINEVAIKQIEYLS